MRHQVYASLNQLREKGKMAADIVPQFVFDLEDAEPETSGSRSDAKAAGKPPPVPRICIIDASGSVKHPFEGATRGRSATTVFDMEKKLVEDMPEEYFRVIFFTSPTSSRLPNGASRFTNGVYVVPTVVPKVGLNLMWNLVKDDPGFGQSTMPHLGFNAIPEEWLNREVVVDPVTKRPKINPSTNQPEMVDKMTKITYFTDGQCDHQARDNLRTSIQRLFQRHSKIDLSIHAVIAETVDFGNEQLVSRTGGSEVFQVLRDGNLTGRLSKFVSYTHNHPDGFVQLSRRTHVAEGFLPFNDHVFRETRVPEFMEYIYRLVRYHSRDREALEGILQSLVPTVSAMVNQKLESVGDRVIDVFCGMFDGTVLDRDVVTFMLKNFVQAERTGKMRTLTELRANLRDLFAQANQALLDNVAGAIGATTACHGCVALGLSSARVTGLPSAPVVFLVHYEQVPTSGLVPITVNGQTYRQAGIVYQGKTLPILPLNGTGTVSAFTGQCLRQWWRVIISRMFAVEILSDTIIFVVMAVNATIQNDPTISDNIKASFKTLTRVMAGKMRKSANMTEYEWWTRGHLPMSETGNTSKWAADMQKAWSVLSRGSSDTSTIHTDMQIWKWLCDAMGDAELSLAQTVHISACNAPLPEMDPVMCIHVPREYEYMCPINLTSTAQTGGIVLRPHYTLNQQECRPAQVFEHASFLDMCRRLGHCHICYTRITETDGEIVGPQPAIDASQPVLIDPTTMIDCFAYTPQGQRGTSSAVTVASSSQSGGGPASSSRNMPRGQKNRSGKAGGQSTSGGGGGVIPHRQSTQVYTPIRKGVLVAMRGIVGAGKTTMATRLTEMLTAAGIQVICEGVDKYCREGQSTLEGINTVAEKLRHIDDPVVSSATLPPLVVILDVCNENIHKGTTLFFQTDFSGWSTHTMLVNYDGADAFGYFAWCLRNVLRRQIPTAAPDCNWWLNPRTASLEVCYNVALKKFKGINTNRANALQDSGVYPQPTSADTIDSYILRLDPAANTYEQNLRPVDVVAGEAVTEILGKMPSP